MAPDTPTGRRSELNPNTNDHDLDTNINKENCYSSNNNSNEFKFDHSLPSSQDSLKLSNSQSFLAPPSIYKKERRLSTSSCDSSASQSSKRRLRRNSSSRFSDFDETGNEVTLLTFAKAVHKVYKKVRAGFRRPFRLLFVTSLRKPNIVCEAEVMEQAIWIVTDYIVNRLSYKQLMNRKIHLSMSDWHGSFYIINAGFTLETMFPKIYSNVSRKLCMTMSSQKIVRTALTSVLDILFEDKITWGKVVSMFAVAGLFAEECVMQGHADYVQDIVDAVTDFIGAHMLQWLVSQGGWEAFPTPESDEKSRLSKMRLMMMIGATITLAMSTTGFLYLW